ncbi:MAG: hypothetical protein QXM43_07850 [Desulfurococcaceae archaeon]
MRHPYMMTYISNKAVADEQSREFLRACQCIAIETHGDLDRIKEALKHLGLGSAFII